MGIANFPFPSFTLILTSDRVVIPGPSYVIRLAPLMVSHQDVRQTAALPTNINANADPVEENHCLINLNLEDNLNDDFSLGHSEPEEFPYEYSDSEARTVQATKSGQKKVRNKLKNILRRLSSLTDYFN